MKPLLYGAYLFRAPSSFDPKTTSVVPDSEWKYLDMAGGQFTEIDLPRLVAYFKNRHAVQKTTRNVWLIL